MSEPAAFSLKEIPLAEPSGVQDIRQLAAGHQECWNVLSFFFLFSGQLGMVRETVPRVMSRKMVPNWALAGLFYHKEPSGTAGLDWESDAT